MRKASGRASVPAAGCQKDWSDGGPDAVVKPLVKIASSSDIAELGVNKVDIWTGLTREGLSHAECSACEV